MKKFQVLTFFALAYAFTWTFHLAIPLLGLSFTFDLANPAMILYLIGIFGPFVSAVSLTGYFEGVKGIRQLLGSALRWQFSIVWYLFALFIVAVLMFVNIGLSIRTLPHPMEWIRFPFLLIVGQLWVVIGEEYGWRGFVLPRLQKQIGSLGASLLIGIGWAAWHLPMFFIPGSPQYTNAFLGTFPYYALIVTFWSIIMTMLYNRTNNSVLICMIFHAALNIAAFMIMMPTDADFLFLLYIPVVIGAIILLPRPLLVVRTTKSAD